MTTPPHEIPPIRPEAVRWSGDPAGRPVMVLLHGYGSNEADLFGLVPLLPAGFVYAAVRAPLPMPELSGRDLRAVTQSPGGYAWYPITDLNDRDPTDTTASAQRFVDWLDADEAISGASSVGLLGFSQGGAISLQAMRLAPSRFSLVVNLSGYVAPGELPGDAELATHPRPVFWGRGSYDEVIPADLVTHTGAWLPAHADLDGHVYPGLGHSISEAELGDLTGFLQRHHDASD